MSLDKLPKPERLVSPNLNPPETAWMDTPVDFRDGTYSYPTNPKNLKYLEMPNPREWSPVAEDWKLPDNWQQIILEGMKERLEKYRSFRLFMDICVRCGACADKCQFFIGSGDPKNMPVLRAELLRSVYKNDFTTVGQDPGKVCRRTGTHHRCPERMVLLFLSVHGMPPMLSVLSLRDRHC